MQLQTSESYFRVKLEEREFWEDLQSSEVLEFWKLQIENIFCIVCELKESENHPFTSFKKLLVVGGWLVGWAVIITTWNFQKLEWKFQAQINSHLKGSFKKKAVNFQNWYGPVVKTKKWSSKSKVKSLPTYSNIQNQNIFLNQNF